jgi:hypothetical protein
MGLVRALALCSLLAALLVLSSEGVQSQEKKEGKSKGQLPQHWSKLELTAVQKDEVYKLNRDHKEKADKLKEELKKLDEDFNKKRLAVLTDDQRRKLIEMLAGEPKPSEKDSTKDKAKGN